MTTTWNGLGGLISLDRSGNVTGDDDTAGRLLIANRLNNVLDERTNIDLTGTIYWMREGDNYYVVCEDRDDVFVLYMNDGIGRSRDVFESNSDLYSEDYREALGYDEWVNSEVDEMRLQRMEMEAHEMDLS
jgi:hypothetical protein